MKTEHNSLKLRWIFAILPAVFFGFNLYASCFPITPSIIGDDAEYLHVAFLIGRGQRPFVDFMENHPQLFSHFLWWLHEFFNPASIRAWDGYARVVIFLHIILLLVSYGLWIREVYGYKSKSMIVLFPTMVIAWAMTGFYNDYFHWIWQLRPDFICYSYTLLGAYFCFHFFKRKFEENSVSILFVILGGSLIGIGNAILPKGVFLLIPMVLVGVIVILLNEDMFHFLKSKNIFINLVLLAFIIGLSFCAGVLFDCHLSQVSIRKWIAAVVLINSKKHIIYTQFDDNPISSIVASFGGIPLVGMIGLITFGAWQVVAPRNTKIDLATMSLFLYSILVIILNLLMPSYTNGVTWSYDFIPSLIAAAVLYFLFIETLLDWWSVTTNSHNRKLIIPSMLFVVLVLQALIPQSVDAYLNYKERVVAQREINTIAPDDYRPEKIFPTSLTYLAQFPYRMPIEARNWSYYFMLVLDNHFWDDCHALGLGPDPQKEWQTFYKHPPDVLAFNDRFEIINFVLALNKCQGIRVPGILNEIQKRYVMVSRRGGSLYVLHKDIPMFLASGWKISAHLETNGDNAGN